MKRIFIEMKKGEKNQRKFMIVIKTWVWSLTAELTLFKTLMFHCISVYDVSGYGFQRPIERRARSPLISWCSLFCQTRIGCHILFSNTLLSPILDDSNHGLTIICLEGFSTPWNLTVKTFPFNVALNLLMLILSCHPTSLVVLVFRKLSHIECFPATHLVQDVFLSIRKMADQKAIIKFFLVFSIRILILPTWNNFSKSYSYFSSNLNWVRQCWMIASKTELQWYTKKVP